MKRIGLPLLIAALSVCALSVSTAASAGFLDAISNKKTLLRTSIRAYEFNKFVEKNLDKHATVYLQKLGRAQTLNITYEAYDATQVITSVNLSEEFVDDYQQAILKYQEWAAKASENGDVFEKEIGKYKAGAGYKVLFTFYGANQSRYFLMLTPCLAFACESQSAVIIDAKGAAELSDLLAKLKAGELPPPDPGNKYN